MAPSQSWFKGPICGVENCRSRRYRSSDGLTICQYGHVMEGNFEYNDDQDQAVVTTKRLNAVQLDDRGTYTRSQRLTQDSRDNEPKRVPGRRSTQIYYRCLQMVLKDQLESALLGYFSDTIRQDLTQVVKINWAKCLAGLEGMEDDPEDSHNDDPDDTPEDDSDDDLADATDDSHIERQERTLAHTKANSSSFRSIKTRRGRPLPKLHLSALDTISIIYISALQLRFQPLYATDIMDGIISNKIPYIRTLHLVPKAFLDEIPLYFHRMLQGYKLPLVGEFYNSVHRTGCRIYRYNGGTTKSMKMPINYYYPLIFRIVSEVLVLPNAIDIFLLIVLVMKKDLEIPVDRAFQNTLIYFPELEIAGTIAFLVKVLFIHTLFRQRLDGARWLEKLEDYEANVEYTTIGESDLNKLLDWSDDKVDQYCEWVFENVIPQHKTQLTEDLPVMEKRLLLIFDVEKDPQAKRAPASHALPEVYQTMAHSTRAKKLRIDTLEKIEDKLVRKLARVFGVPDDVLLRSTNYCEGNIMKKRGNTIL